ncbi:MAG TPA: hypothetical protein VGQ64_04585, partial [Candidatus Limnocylindrales bacterium]|nr:hypothetical protein [Candidatus Limnocylindrales bacterium]
MPVSTDPQLALDERAVNHPDLEKALEKHLRARDDASEARGVVKAAKKEIDAHLATIGDFEPETAIRVGRFRITKRHVEAKHVEFDADARDQISIGLVDEDGNAARRGRGGRQAKPVSVSDDADLRPTGEVNPDALRGEADRA